MYKYWNIVYNLLDKCHSFISTYPNKNISEFNKTIFNSFLVYHPIRKVNITIAIAEFLNIKNNWSNNELKYYDENKDVIKRYIEELLYIIGILQYYYIHTNNIIKSTKNLYCIICDVIINAAYMKRNITFKSHVENANNNIDINVSNFWFW